MDTTERNALLNERRSLVEEIRRLRTQLAGIDAGLAEPDVAKVRENDLTLVYATLSLAALAQGCNVSSQYRPWEPKGTQWSGSPKWDR